MFRKLVGILIIGAIFFAAFMTLEKCSSEGSGLQPLASTLKKPELTAL